MLVRMFIQRCVPALRYRIQPESEKMRPLSFVDKVPHLYFFSAVHRQVLDLDAGCVYGENLLLLTDFLNQFNLAYLIIILSGRVLAQIVFRFAHAR